LWDRRKSAESRRSRSRRLPIHNAGELRDWKLKPCARKSFSVRYPTKLRRDGRVRRGSSQSKRLTRRSRRMSRTGSSFLSVDALMNSRNASGNCPCSSAPLLWRHTMRTLKPPWSRHHRQQLLRPQAIGFRSFWALFCTLHRPHAAPSRQTHRLPKIGDRAISKIWEAEKDIVRCLANLADCP
jgi:hypothetical protein